VTSAVRGADARGSARASTCSLNGLGLAVSVYYLAAAITMFAADRMLDATEPDM